MKQNFEAQTRKGVYIPFGHAKRISDIETFLPGELVYDLNEAAYVAGWGYRPSGIKAKSLALNKNKRYLSLEEGFIAKIPYLNDNTLISLAVDSVAPYFDTTEKTDLESLLIRIKKEDLPSNLNFLFEKWKELNPKKYLNIEEQFALDLYPVNSKYVVIIDQISGDASLNEEIVGKRPFKRLLDFIVNNYPEMNVLIKKHPKEGSRNFLKSKKSAIAAELKHFKSLKVSFLSANFEIDLLRNQIQEVLVVNSLMGAELLLKGYNVRTFGSPWYSGWGLTEDEGLCERKQKIKKIISREELFYCAYVQYNKYVHPVTRKKCCFSDILEHLELQKKVINRFPRKLAVLNAQKWKKPYYDKFMQFSTLRYISEKDLHTLKREEGLISWGQRFNQSHLDYLRRKGFKVYQCEDGFLRSFGLGCEFTKPFSLSFDDKGLYANPKLGSSLAESISHSLNCAQAKEARLFIKLFRSLKLTKYMSIGSSLSNELLDLLVKNNEKRILLVCGQVSDDVSFLNSDFNLLTFQNLVNQLKKENPHSFLIYRPHPDCFKGIRQGEVDLEGADFIDIKSNISSLIDLSDEVHVVNSLTGVEALMLGKKVVCWGNSWYSGRGLTEDKNSLITKKEPVSLEQLVYIAYIYNPIYFDYSSNQYTSVFNLLEVIKSPTSVERNTPLIAKILDRIPFRLKDKVSYFIHLFLRKTHNDFNS